MPSTLLRGGRVLCSASKFDATADVLLKDGRVASINATPGSGGGADQTMDCAGLLVCPGLIDPHVHLREPGGEHKETIHSGTEAAVAGGFTSVCCMPNTKPCLDSAPLVEFVRMRAREARMARVFVTGAATVERKGEQLAPLAAMKAAGAVAFSDDGDGIESAQTMLRVLQMCKSVGAPFMQHCQEPSLTRGAAMNSGPLQARLGLGSWPAVAEELMLMRDIMLNHAVGARYHAQHVSTAGSVEIIRRARADGQPVSGEASPHHLLLTDEACDGYNTDAKMNPPLRTQRDVDALRQGVADGTINVLATDHAPHTEAEKAKDFANAPFGIVGLEAALPLYAKALVESGAIGWPRLIELMTLEPARLLGIDAQGFGALKVGGPGDVTVIDPSAEWTIDRRATKSKSTNTPFDGWKVRGRAMAVFVRGERVGG
ncbi:MAG: dihydroorotase [Phycisphaerae bacterium]|nr:dihydroorotase [Phycisphaerae bacterium]